MALNGVRLESLLRPGGVFVLINGLEVVKTELMRVNRLLDGDIVGRNRAIVRPSPGRIEISKVLRIQMVAHERLVNGGLGQLEPIGDGRRRELALVD